MLSRELSRLAHLLALQLLLRLRHHPPAPPLLGLLLLLLLLQRRRVHCLVLSGGL